MNVFPNKRFQIWDLILVVPLILKIFPTLGDRQSSEWNSDCLGNSYPWMSLIPSSQPSKILPIIEWLASSPATLDILFCLFVLDYSHRSRMIWILQTIPIPLYRFPWRNFETLQLLENWYYQVALINHEVFVRTLRIARFRREEFLRDQVELVVPFSKNFNQVVLIYLLQQLISMDHDFRNVSCPGSLKLKTIRTMASWQLDSTKVSILLWLAVSE